MTKAKTCLRDAQHRQKQYYDSGCLLIYQGHSYPLYKCDLTTELKFNVGDKVCLKSKNIPIQGLSARKLMPLWLGPFAVVAKVGAVTYQLDIPAHCRRHNIFRVKFLKPAYDNLLRLLHLLLHFWMVR